MGIFDPPSQQELYQQQQQADQQKRISEYQQAFQQAFGGQMPNLTNVNQQIQTQMDALKKAQQDFQDKVTGYQDAGGRRFEKADVQYDSQGRPITQSFESARDANGGLLNQYKLNAQPAVTANRDALDAMRAQGLASGNSPWAQSMLDKQKLEQAQAMDSARQGVANRSAQAQGLLAQTGGLNGAGRMSMARQAMRQGAQASQDVNRQGLLDRASIGVQDQQNKQSLLSQIQQGEMGMANLDQANRQYQTGVDQTNLQNQLGDLTQKRMYDSNNFNQAMQAWAANKSADAQAKAAGGGGKK